MHRAGRPPDGHLNRLDVAGPVQDGVGAASLTARTQVVEQPRPGRRPAAAARCFWTARRCPARQVGERQPSLPATARCRRCGRHALLGVLQTRVVQLRHRAVLGAAWHQPSGAPRQRLPAGNVLARCFSDGAALARPPDPPQPVQLRRQRPGAVLQVLQVAEAVERPPMDAARPAAPIAGLRGARTGVVGLRPAAAPVGLVEPRSGLKADLPGPAGHWVSPPLAWLPGSDQPAERAGTAQPEPHGARPPYSPAVGPAGTVWVPSAARRRDGLRTLDRGGLDHPVVSCQQGWGRRCRQQVVDGRLGAVVAAGWHSNGPVRSLGATRP
jgi:hypothetical protein